MTDKIRVRNWKDVKATAHERGLTDPVEVAETAQEQMADQYDPDGCFTLPDGSCVGADCMHTRRGPEIADG